MRKIFTFLLVLMTTGSLFAQYSVFNSTGTDAAYDYNASGTDILTPTATEVLSSWQTLPFSFDFYGQPVTGYYASDNGYITFDQNATTSVSANTSLPDVTGPNNAIYSFWDNTNVVTGSGSADRVTSWTYGSSPTRVHVIQWYSVTPNSGTGFVYSAIRIYECGDFDVVLSFGNATGMTATIGCENNDGTVGTQVAGSPSIGYPSVGSGQADDVVYSFLDSGTSYDVAMTSIGFSGSVPIGNNTITGTLTNNGSAAITTLTLNYTINGGTPVTDSKTGLNIQPGATYNWSHGTQWNVAAGGVSSDLCVYATNINGNTDQRTCNDQICENLFSNTGTTGAKTALIEEFTGAWCGWCPDGAVVLETILDNNPGKAFGVSVHDNDDMEFNDGIRSGFGVSAYPNGMVDRRVFAGEPDEPHSRGAWTGNTNTALAEYTPVNVSFTQNSWNPTTREITIEAKADFVDYAAGDMRIIFYVVEDSVTGTGSGYNQVNYLNTQAGHPYFGAGDPIVGYIHRHTLRALPSGAYGNAGVIPANVNQGDSYSESFTYTLPAGYDETRISIIAAVGLYSTGIGERYIHNTYGEDLNLIQAGLVDDISPVELTVFPNPVSDYSVAKVSFTANTTASFDIYNTFGQKVATIGEGSFAPGVHKVEFDVRDLESGVYFLTVNTQDGRFTEKIIVAK